MDVALV